MSDQHRELRSKRRQRRDPATKDPLTIEPTVPHNDPGLPGPHPLPTPALDERPLPIRRADQTWYRFHAAHLGPIFFGKTGYGRFDAPEQEFGALYVGADAHCAFIETFGHDHPGSARMITTTALRARSLVRVRFARPLMLVDLTAEGLAQIGADMRICVGDYRTAQWWTRGLWAHPEQPDGIYYRSRHDSSRYCAAIFDRPDLLDPTVSAPCSTTHALRRLLADLFDTYRFGLIDD